MPERGRSGDAVADRRDRRWLERYTPLLQRQQSKSNGQVLSLGGGVTRSLLLLLVSLYFDSNVWGERAPSFLFIKTNPFLKGIAKRGPKAG